MRSFLHEDLIFKFSKSQDIGVMLLEFRSIPSQNKTRNNYFTKYNPMLHLGVDILEKKSDFKTICCNKNKDIPKCNLKMNLKIW